MTLSGLQQQLQQQFPNYRCRVFGRQLLVSESLLEGCGVVIKPSSLKIAPIPASLGSIALAAALFALLVIPGVI